MNQAQQISESLGEAEMSLRSNSKLHKQAVTKAQKEDNDHMLTLLKAMNPKKLSHADIESLKVFLGIDEGRQSGVTNPNLKKAYGVSSFGDVYELIQKQWPKILKGAIGYVLDSTNSTAPVGIVTRDGITWLGMRGTELVGIRAQAVFPISDIKP